MLDQYDQNFLITLITEGTVLNTKDGSFATNAIVISGANEHPIKVLTDFGNVREFADPYEVLGQYHISDSWYEYTKMGYPFPTISERIKEQIRLLSEHI